jgi:hypothetical protein
MSWEQFLWGWTVAVVVGFAWPLVRACVPWGERARAAKAARQAHEQLNVDARQRDTSGVDDRAHSGGPVAVEPPWAGSRTSTDADTPIPPPASVEAKSAGRPIRRTHVVGAGGDRADQFHSPEGGEGVSWLGRALTPAQLSVDGRP